MGLHYRAGLTTTDMNKQVTDFHYDVFGRLEETIFPDTGIKYLEYLDWGNPNQQRVRETVNDGTVDGLWTETYFDGLERIYRIDREGNPRNLPPSSTVFTQDTIYADNTSLVFQQSHWYESGEKPVYETYEYDAAGRPVRQIHPDGYSSRLEYGNDATQTWMKVYDEVDHRRITYFDAYGRVAKVGEINQGKQSDTIYTYDSLDQLLTITDIMGNLTSLKWNMLGFNESKTDPDRGTWTYTYDQVGNVKIQTDARKLTVIYTYDALNQLETKTYPDGRLIKWNYDEPNHGESLGQLTSITDFSRKAMYGQESRKLDV